MSQGHERKEKVCLNCNARVFGPYCHVCGQHNVEPKETAWGLVVHFFNDITHFEGKFITSLRYILFKPGFLTLEYERGRRASYMNPVRMYVFASAFFFILFFSFFSKKEGEIVKFNETKDSTEQMKKPSVVASQAKEAALKTAETKEDSAAIEKTFNNKLVKTITENDTSKSKKAERLVKITGNNYKTISEYDSLQNTLPEQKRDNWLERMLIGRVILIDQKFNGDLKKFNHALYEEMMHSLPKMLFISLPLFAFALYLLYIRRKRFYYVTHIIFTIHLYVFVFIMLLLYFANGKLTFVTWWPASLVSFAIGLYVYIYLYKAMRRVYAQGRFKTILKYFILLFLLFLLFTFLFIGLFSYTLFNV
ncbi:MAG: DUF3667 domain-containing protein [Chitinophagaceae bacterium]|nr:DUF3667 domain-containing protein [Chitinophagaceae bacterium]